MLARCGIAGLAAIVAVVFLILVWNADCNERQAENRSMRPLVSQGPGMTFSPSGPESTAHG